LGVKRGNNYCTKEELAILRSLGFGDKLKALCQANRVTNAGLAEAIGLTSTETLMNYRRSQIMPSIQILIKISYFFDVPLDDLIDMDKFNKFYDTYDQADSE